MRTVFAIAPWEYPGAAFDPHAHAFTRHVFAGCERELWLKMRAGVIYFGEVEGARVYAVTRLFDDAISVDAERLIAVWRGEVERENYGVYTVVHYAWPRLPVHGNFCVILRATGIGWIKEYFDDEWHEVTFTSSKTLNLWRSQDFTNKSSKIVQKSSARFLDRAVAPLHFQTTLQKWSEGGSNKIFEVMRNALFLWMPTQGVEYYRTNSIPWRFVSGSAFREGAMSSRFLNLPNRHIQTVWRELEKRSFFTGIQWKLASEKPNPQLQYGPIVWKRGYGKWGENWRGNFNGSWYSENLEMPIWIPSQHERLEAALFMCEFLTDKLPAEQIKAMLRDALQN